MNLVNLKRVSDRDVEVWLKESINNLTLDQLRQIERDEIVRQSPYFFMESRGKVDNVLLRFTVVFIPIVFLILVLGLPFYFLISGKWGYNHEQIKWYLTWVSACGL